MNFVRKMYYKYQRLRKTIAVYLMVAGPGIIVMIADNDAGGITIYAATGVKYGYHLIWLMIVLMSRNETGPR